MAGQMKIAYGQNRASFVPFLLHNETCVVDAPNSILFPLDFLSIQTCLQLRSLEISIFSALIRR